MICHIIVYTAMRIIGLRGPMMCAGILRTIISIIPVIMRALRIIRLCGRLMCMIMFVIRIVILFRSFSRAVAMGHRASSRHSSVWPPRAILA